LITVIYEIQGERTCTSGHPTSVWQKVEHRKAVYGKSFKLIEVK